jgi:rod shape-determining protein MreD
VIGPRAGIRWAALVLMCLLALLLQTSLFDAFAWDGVVPDLVLLVVVAAGLVEGGQLAMILGFVAGLLLDLAPPADHLAGRWALALLVVGYVAGRVRQYGDRLTPLTAVATAAGCSFVGTSVFALTGVILHDHPGDFGRMLSVIGIALVWDAVAAVFVLPAVMAVLHRLEDDRIPA